MSDTPPNPQILAYPLYALFHIRDPLAPGDVDGVDLSYFCGENLERLPRIVEHVRAALLDPEYDFLSVLPNLPFENDVIRRWIEGMLTRMEKEI